MDYDKLQQYLYAQWNEDIDTKTSATGARLLKVLSSVGFMNVVYLKKSFRNAIFSTASDRNIVIKKARSEKGYKALPVVSAYVNITFSVPTAKTNTILIPKWTKVTTVDLTTNYTFYTIEDTTILAGELSTTVLAVEGSRIQLTFIAGGTSYESFDIKRSDITLRDIEVYVNGTKWDVIDDIIDASATDYVWTYEPEEEGKISVMFGNDIYGVKLSVRDTVDIWCLVSAGLLGNIKANCITKIDSTIYDSTHTVISDIICNNLSKSYGGAEMESINVIIQNSYNSYGSNWGLVTLEQYTNALVALSGIDRAYCRDINVDIDVPFRQVWGYIVDSDGNNVVDPYLTEAINYVDEHKTVGTEFYVKPVLYTNYLVNIDVWLHTGYNSSAVITEITDLINTTYSKPGMGISVNVELSHIGEELNNMDAVAHYDIILPSTDVTVPSGYLANVVGTTVTMKGYL
jgi:hypothetical protein